MLGAAPRTVATDHLIETYVISERPACCIVGFGGECVSQITDFSISGERLTRELDQLTRIRRLPQNPVLDNGPEFTAKAMYFWATWAGVKLRFIQPGKPTQNAFVESFNGKFRGYLLESSLVPGFS